LLLIVATLVGRRIWRWRWNSIRRPRHRTRLLCLCIIVRTTPSWICWLAIVMIWRWLLVNLRGWVWSSWWWWNVVWRWRLMMCRSTIWGRCMMAIGSNWWLLNWLIIRWLWTRRICLCTGSLILASHWWVAAVKSTWVFVLETQTSHLSLNILNHFPALNVPCHYKVVALLLYVCDCILSNKEIAYYCRWYSIWTVSSNDVIPQILGEFKLALAEERLRASMYITLDKYKKKMGN